MKILKISSLFFLFGVYLLQFYIFSSGALQPSHLFILFSFIILFTIGIPKNILKNKSFFNLTIFVIITIIINLIYGILYSNIDFLISSSYYIYGLIFTYITILLLTNQPNLNFRLANILFCSLLTLVFIWVFGFGTYALPPRYNGYFNDPNQMSHWSLCVAVCIILLSKSNLIKYITVFLTFIIIIVSFSRSGLSGFAFLLLALLIPNKKNILYVFTGIMIIIATISLTNIKKTDFFENYENVVERFLKTDFSEQADIRGYTRAQKYPEYLFFGSGQGLDTRFNSQFEIHSSWMGILFYYGFFALTFFLSILYNLISKLSFDNILAFLGPLVYGFSTFGIRTPVFWLLLGVLIYVTNFKNNKFC